MALRTGAQYIESLRDGREVWIGSERVDDVTTHPALKPVIESTARLYDMQHDPAYADVLGYDCPELGERIGRTFQVPRSIEDLKARRAAIRCWQETSFGMMGRAPDFLNSMMASLKAKASVFARQAPERGEAVSAYYEHCARNDIFLTHALIDPQMDRSRPRHQQPDPGVPLRVVDRTSEGLVVSGAKMVATAAAYTDEVLVWPFPPTFVPGDEDYGIVIAMPMATPGLKILCRAPFAHDDGRDFPLSAHFDEMDSVLVFEEVLVPWERVFLHQDVELMNAMYRDARIRELTAHQTNIRLLVKLETLYALLTRMAEAIGVDRAPAVMTSLGEAATHVETIRNCIMAAEYQAAVDPENGVLYPDFAALQVGRMLGPRIYPQMVAKVKRMGAGGLMQLPASMDAFDSEVGPLLERFYRGANMSAREKTALFRFAWDVCGTEFGARHDLYELYYAGDPDALLAGMHREYPRRAEQLERFDALRREMDG